LFTVLLLTPLETESIEEPNLHTLRRLRGLKEEVRVIRGLSESQAKTLQDQAKALQRLEK
jgi:hypothetical protein